jgi:hypothetical protein
MMTPPSAAARNALVTTERHVLSPPIDQVGVTIGIDRGHEVFQPGTPIVLRGALLADARLIDLLPEEVSASVMLTILRTDAPDGATLRLISPEPHKVAAVRPQGATPPTVTTSGTFNVDLRAFFGLAAETGSYTVQATIGPYFSSRVTFRIEQP